MSSNSPATFVRTTTDSPTVDDTAEIDCRGCGERFERTDPRVFGAPVAYACPECGTSVKLWLAGGELQYES
ncbi:hypothetical protein [Halobaculum sp. MBLA0143]|uniref:hypothetical protein n=1 Tax=Halobaculum sp. MBLA0143 TaxID=3079933 RepID=UPI0035237065